MRNFDLSPLIQNDIQYEKIVSGIANSYKCDWDDAVHDSYGKYVEQMQTMSKELKIIRTNAEVLVKEIVELKTEEYTMKSNELSEEVNAI